MTHSWLTHPSGERGAAATLVAILALGGVLLGMLALSVDVGNMMFERRQLQNGADASAMALAQLCAKNLDNCDPTTSPATLTPLNNANASSDGKHGLESVDRTDTLNGQCGRVPGIDPAVLPECDSATSTADPVDVAADLAQCPALPALLADNPDIAYVETYTRTQSSDGGSLLDFFFEEGGATVTACARAAWGPMGNPGGVLPIAISACDYEKYVGDPTDPDNMSLQDAPEGAWPGYGPGKTPWPAIEHQHYTAQSEGLPGCEIWNGKMAPGNFSSLDNSNCTVTVPEDRWVKGEQGNGYPTGCGSDILKQYRGTVVDIPIIDCFAKTKNGTCEGNGSGWYHVVGFAKFYLSGWKLTGNEAANCVPTGQSGSACDKSLRDGASLCTGASGGSGRCFSGWFVRSVGSGVIDPDAIDLGNTAVMPAG